MPLGWVNIPSKNKNHKINLLSKNIVNQFIIESYSISGCWETFTRLMRNLSIARMVKSN